MFQLFGKNQVEKQHLIINLCNRTYFLNLTFVDRSLGYSPVRDFVWAHSLKGSKKEPW